MAKTDGVHDAIAAGIRIYGGFCPAGRGSGELYTKSGQALPPKATSLEGPGSRLLARQ